MYNVRYTRLKKKFKFKILLEGITKTFFFFELKFNYQLIFYPLYGFEHMY